MKSNDFAQVLRRVQSDINNRLEGLIRLNKAGILIDDMDERIAECINAIDNLEKSINMTLENNSFK